MAYLRRAGGLPDEPLGFRIQQNGRKRKRHRHQRQAHVQCREQESADRLASLIEERNTAKEVYDRAQAEIDKLAERTKDTVDPEAYSFFLERIPDLSKTEREIFDYYVSGLSTKEILESANIKESTLKYHNSHIYEKLNVKSRKELLVYISLMNRSKDGGNDCDTGTKTE